MEGLLGLCGPSILLIEEIVELVAAWNRIAIAHGDTKYVEHQVDHPAALLPQGLLVEVICTRLAIDRLNERVFIFPLLLHPSLLLF